MDLANEVQPAEDAVARWVAEIGAVYDLVTGGSEGCFKEAGFLPIGAPVAAKVRADTGLDVLGYEHIMDTFSVRHILKNHGTEAERKRGQVPITRQDLVQLTELLLDPDTVEHAGKTKQGRDVLHYTKAVGEHVVFYTEEMRTKKSRLAAVTLYKRRNKGR